MALWKVGRWQKKKTSATIFWLLPALHFAQNAHLVSAMAIYDAMNSSQTYYSTILGRFSSISGSLTFSGWGTLMLSQYKAKQVTIANSCVLTYSRIILLITEPQPFSNELLYVHVICDFFWLSCYLTLVHGDSPRPILIERTALSFSTTSQWGFGTQSRLWWSLKPTLPPDLIHWRI